MEMEKLVRARMALCSVNVLVSSLFGADRGECAAVCALTACKTMMDAKTNASQLPPPCYIFPTCA